MKIHLLVALAAVSAMAVLLPLEGTAAEFPHPKVEYSADMAMTISNGEGQSYRINGKVYSAKGKQRREISGFGRRTVVIKTGNETLTLIPDQKMYMKSRTPGAHKDPEEMVRDGEISLTKEGTEKINDQMTTRYKLESTDKGRNNFSGHAWFNKHNIPVRFKGTTRDRNTRQNVEINYYNINVARQNPKLFAAPDNYRLLPTGAGGMGGGPAEMSPEQLKRMKEMMEKQQNR